MWIQIIKGRLKAGKEADFVGLMDKLMEIEQPGSGLISEVVTRSQQDPDVVYVIATFDSEEAARVREADPRRQAGLVEVRKGLMDALDGPPEFIDLDVLAEHGA
ncbi:MAG TPA: antibiotic biosynthesis monooxygenase [Mycobacteriales bacterium]|nr:antibiotic biosynthesis monooxygenase [Mycobacteriales bacterium]HWA65494.1 antibiotic biosynthesis monooxygenase [Mycobacteriales bacterium]